MRFIVLDSWRGIAALFVALYRFEADGALFHLPIVRNAGLFVDFFFVLSGFVIAHTYFDRLVDKPAFLQFAVRRFGRLWPLHAVMFLPFLAFEIARWRYGLAGGGESAPFTGYRAPGTIPVELAFMNSLGIYPATGWNTPSWSISSEFWTYLLFGIICLSGRRWIGPIAFGLFVACLAVVAYHSPEIDVTFGLGTFRCMAGFFAGVCCHFVWRALDGSAVSERWAIMEIPVLIVAFGFVHFAGSSPISFAAPVVFGDLVLVFAGGHGVISRVLKSQPFRFLGELSYSIYMTSLLVALVFGRLIVAAAKRFGLDIVHDVTVGQSVHTVFGFAVSPLNDLLMLSYGCLVVICSFVTYRLVERPGRRIFNRWSEQLNLRVDQSPRVSP